jgi:hypothetical protein
VTKVTQSHCTARVKSWYFSLLARNGSSSCFLFKVDESAYLVSGDYATIDHGVIVKQSNIDQAGRGLFADRPFEKGELVTKYDGQMLRDESDACHVQVQTHVLCANVHPRGIGNKVYVNGDHEPVSGRGGGSFINHQRSGVNVEFVAIEKEAFVVATQHIKKGDELMLYSLPMLYSLLCLCSP